MSSKINWSHARLGRMSKSGTGTLDLDKFCARLNNDISSGELPFISLDFFQDLKADLERLDPFLEKFDHLLLLGIGGSSLGARALQKAFFPQQDLPGHQGPWLWIADNVCSRTLSGLTTKLPPGKTMVLVVSKSGGTIETIGQYLLVKDWMEKSLGSSWKEHFFFITDPAKGFLRQEAVQHEIRTMSVPEKLGGRYSVLSAVGLLPARFLNMDISELMRGALDAAAVTGSGSVTPEQLQSCQAYKLASWARDLMQAEYSKLIFFVYLPLWAQFGNWFAQLWAESIGKNGLGSMPVPATGVSDQHSLQQMFLDGPRDMGCLFITGRNMPQGPQFGNDLADTWSYLRGKRFGSLLDAEAAGTMMALTQTEVPLVNIQMADDGLYSAGRLMVLLEITTLFTGWMLDINPLDQPAVELGKRLAKARLGADGLEQEKQSLNSFFANTRSLEEL